MYNLKIIIALFFVHFNLCYGENDWQFSMSSMDELFDVAVNHLIMTETYIKNEYKRLDEIRSFIAQRKKQNEKELAERYVESSINAFKTIYRIKTDWEKLRDEMTQTTKIEEFKGASLVTHDNIVSGLKAIRRLQIVYDLEADQIGNGDIDGYTLDQFDGLTLLNSNGEVRTFIDTCQKKKNPFPHPYLKCRYINKGHAFLTIVPLREEIISLIPSIKLYHGVLSDNKIEKVKKLAKPKLERLSNDTNEDITLRKVAAFKKYDDQVFDVIHHILGQIGSISKTRGFNGYKVTNYGLCGHYLPHTQYIDDDHLINSRGKEAIVIFHMDDVPKGGDTVLTDVRVNIPSTKGSAVVVYNTRGLKYPMDDRIMFQHTQYGSCPILYGDKWTLTGWLEWF